MEYNHTKKYVTNIFHTQNMEAFSDFTPSELHAEIIHGLEIIDSNNKTWLSQQLSHSLDENYGCTLFNYAGGGDISIRINDNTISVTNHHNNFRFFFGLGEVMLSEHQEKLFALFGLRVVRREHSCCLTRQNPCRFGIFIDRNYQPVQQIKLGFYYFVDAFNFIDNKWFLVQTIKKWRLYPSYPGDFAISQALLAREIEDVYTVVEDLLPIHNLVGLVCENLINQDNLLHWRQNLGNVANVSTRISRNKK